MVGYSDNVLTARAFATRRGEIVRGTPELVALGALAYIGLTLALSLPVFMALWFAPALVFFNGMAPIAALKASFDACLKNTLAFLVYGLIVLVLDFFAALPVMLGFLVLIPVLAGSLYASYRDVFVAN